MGTRQFAKLLTLFVGAGYVTRDLSSFFAIPRRGFDDGLIASGFWVAPATTILIFALLYWCVAKMPFDDTKDSARALVVASVKLFGLYLFVIGLLQLVGGVFDRVQVQPVVWNMPDAEQSYVMWRSIVMGGLRLILGYVFVFKTAAIVRWLAIRE